MGMTTDPAEREALIAGLRELADFLTENPAVPVPRYGSEITMYPYYDGTDADKAAEVDTFAAATGAEVLDDRAKAGRYEAARTFGRVTYRALTHTAQCLADFDARQSYADCIQTDSPAGPGPAEIAEAA